MGSGGMMSQTKPEERSGLLWEYRSNIDKWYQDFTRCRYGVELPDAIRFQFNNDINRLGIYCEVSVCNKNFEWDGGPKNIFEAWNIAKKYFESLPFQTWITSR